MFLKGLEKTKLVEFLKLKKNFYKNNFQLENINYNYFMENFLTYKKYNNPKFNNYKIFLQNIKKSNLVESKSVKPYLFLNSSLSTKNNPVNFLFLNTFLIKNSKLKSQKWINKSVRRTFFKKTKFINTRNFKKTFKTKNPITNIPYSKTFFKKHKKRNMLNLNRISKNANILNNKFYIFVRRNIIRKKNKFFKKYKRLFLFKDNNFILKPVFYKNFSLNLFKSFNNSILIFNLYERKNFFNVNFYKKFNENLVKIDKLNNSLLFKEKLLLKTRTGKNFIFKNFSLFLFNKQNYSNTKYFKYKYQFKKILFSFLFPNQVRKNIMNRKRKIIISRFFSKFKRYSNKNFRFSLTFLKKNFKDFFCKNIINTSFFNNNIVGNLDFLNNNTTINDINYYKNSSNEIIYDNVYRTRGTDSSYKIKEVRISRIRFKPGYQVIWRNARLAVKESLNLKFRYQYSLTRYLTRFYRQTNSYSFTQSEMSLVNIVMYSKLLPDKTSFLNYLKNNLVYLNGKLAKNLNEVLVKSDFIQLIVSKWYYILYKWLLNWTTTRIKKFKRLVYRKGLASKHKLMKTRKQKSTHTPLWIHNVRYDLQDVKPYLEVDYFTLSVFVLYDPFFINYSSPNDMPDSRINIFKLYNWKYIN